MSRLGLIAAFATITTLTAAASAASARAPHTDAADHLASEAVLENVRMAIEEQRFIDASRLMDEALLAGARDPRLSLAGGSMNLARGRFAAALEGFKAAESAPATQAAALEGKGIALIELGHSDEAMSVLQKAIAADPQAWRAWNALASLYDQRGQWDDAKTAYEHALAASNGSAIVLNNRGYSRLLQNQRDEAVADFVQALKQRPAMAEARTNLRLALAMGGDYDRALAGGAPDDQAALLNNAGFAAAMRGDYSKAEDLLGRAVKINSTFYGRAAENLKRVHALAAKQDGKQDARP